MSALRRGVRTLLDGACRAAPTVGGGNATSAIVSKLKGGGILSKQLACIYGGVNHMGTAGKAGKGDGGVGNATNKAPAAATPAAPTAAAATPAAASASPAAAASSGGSDGGGAGGGGGENGTGLPTVPRWAVVAATAVAGFGAVATSMSDATCSRLHFAFFGAAAPLMRVMDPETVGHLPYNRQLFSPAALQLNSSIF